MTVSQGKRLIMGLLCLGMLVSAIHVSLKLGESLLLESEGPMHSDAQSYTLVARAILNGLQPYADLAETKPPGIFLIIAASLWLTGGEMLATWIQMATFLLLPILFGLFAFWSCGKDSRSMRTWTLTGAAYISGVLFVLYTEERSGALQPEGFGYFFSTLYAMILLKTGLKSKWSIAGASFTLLFSIGMKEPFIITNLAIALLLSPSWKDLPRTFFLPLAIGGITGAALLAPLGILWPYMSIQLPNMLGHRILETTEYNPLLLRPLRLMRVYADLVAYYPSGRFTGWFIIALWLSAPVLLVRKRQNALTVVCTAVAMLCSMKVMDYLFQIFMLKGTNPGTDLVYPFEWYAWIGGLLAAIAGLAMYARPVLHRFVVTLIALYLVALAIAAGVAYHPNFFVFAIPVYGALALLWIQSASNNEVPMEISGALVILLIIAGIANFHDPRHLNGHAQRTTYNYAHNKEAVLRLDALLDACDIDRAVINVGSKNLTFSQHSPWGPFTGLNVPEYYDATHPYTARTVENVLDRTPIMVVEMQQIAETPLIKPILSVIEERFTAEPPDCAKPYLPLYDFTVLFRKGV